MQGRLEFSYAVGMPNKIKIKIKMGVCREKARGSKDISIKFQDLGGVDIQ